MVDGISVKVRGLERSLTKLRAIAPGLDEAVVPALEKSALEVVELSQKVAPKRTGRYARSINAKRIDGTATAQNRNYVSPMTGKRVSRNATFKKLSVTENSVEASAAYGVFAAWIWHFLEFGTLKRAATPHLFPSYRLLRKRIVGRTRRAMGKAIKDALK